MSAKAAAFEPLRDATLQRLQELRKDMQLLSVDDELSTESVPFMKIRRSEPRTRLRRGLRRAGRVGRTGAYRTLTEG
ncbi:hypothetical protein ABZZ47_02130 [Streptomyces sp. NPDC006465]|uniref:hypothetical protein n=1 Tax=Streptomyces sp. NPDC006465 TaxID=3157174 RepID=UPI0033A60502